MLENTPTLGVKVVHTFVNVIIYEPTNAISCENRGEETPIVTETDHTYFNNIIPTILLDDLFDLTSVGTSFNSNGPNMLQCKGVDEPHLFLSKTGWNRCHQCNVVVCGYCSGAISAKKYCLRCFASGSLVTSRYGGYMKRIDSMQKELTEQFQFS